MSKWQILVWVDRIVLVWASIWLMRAIVDIMFGSYVAGAIGLIVQGFAIWAFYCKFLPRDKARLQAEKDRRVLDKLDW